MVLPILGGILGSALLGGSMSPFLASAIGTGIGAFAETGDVEDALTAGVTGAIGGQLLGGLTGGGGIGSLLGGSTAGQTAGALAGQAGTQAAGQAAQQAAQGATAGVADKVVAPGVVQAMGPGLGTAATPGMIAGPPVRPEQFGGPEQGLFGGKGLKDILTGPGLMSGVIGAASLPPAGFDDDSGGGPGRAEAPGRSLRTTGPVGGRGAEFNYRVQPNYGLANGGEVPPAGIAAMGVPPGMGGEPQMSEQQIIQEAIAAIQEQHPRPEIALGRFLKVFGEQALMDLIDSVSSGEFSDTARRSEGLINGPGGPRDDMVPATVDGESEVMLSDGEFVVPYDVVTGLGEGDSEQGVNALYGMLDRVRAGEGQSAIGGR